MKKWWVSWYGCKVAFTLHSPWWYSGFRMEDDGDIPTICAAIIAEDEEAARRIVIEAHDKPVVPEWRFVEARPEDWTPFCDRFQRKDWMKWPD